jgi:hypothetical protein
MQKINATIHGHNGTRAKEIATLDLSYDERDAAQMTSAKPHDIFARFHMKKEGHDETREKFNKTQD